MKLHKNNLGMLERAKKTLFGRIVMRLAGEEKGAIMMEYVIVATLIAAAVAVGVWLFGGQILAMFGVAGESVIAKEDAAEQHVDTIQQNADAVMQTGREAAESRIEHSSGEGTNTGNY